MKGIYFVVDDYGRAIAVQIDLKRHGYEWEEFWDGILAESRRKEKSIPYATYRARRGAGRAGPSRSKLRLR